MLTRKMFCKWIETYLQRTKLHDNEQSQCDINIFNNYQTSSLNNISTCTNAQRKDKFLQGNKSYELIGSSGYNNN